MLCQSVAISVIFLLMADFSKSEKMLYFENMELISYDKEYYSSVDLSLKKITDDNVAVDCITDQVKDLENMEVNMKALVWSNNEYIDTGIEAKIPACEFITDRELNILIDAGSDGVHGNLPKECLEMNKFPKNRYYLKDLNVVKAPPLLPLGRYKVTTQYMINDKIIMDIVWYSRVVEE